MRMHAALPMFFALLVSIAVCRQPHVNLSKRLPRIVRSRPS